VAPAQAENVPCSPTAAESAKRPSGIADPSTKIRGSGRPAAARLRLDVDGARRPGLASPTPTRRLDVQRWLFKTEPSTYAFAQLVRERRTAWDGVANALARKHLRAVARGDLVLIYHTGDDKAVVGVAEAVSDPYPDPRRGADTGAVVVDVAAKHALPRPVTLAELKRRPDLATFPLVRLPRLAVMPVTAAEWNAIERLARS
jgi:predicted RNA-binding protein with PUA-like domain